MTEEKAAVDMASLSAEELARVLSAFGFDSERCTVEQVKGGGYSSLNYALNVDHGKEKLLLRVPVGLPEASVRRQVAVLKALSLEMKVRSPRPTLGPQADGDHVVSCRTTDGKEAFAALHSWVEGLTANKLVNKNESGMLQHLGSALASLHVAKQPTSELGLKDVASDSYMQDYMHWPAEFSWQDGFDEVVKHAGESVDFVEFLRDRWKPARLALEAVGLTRGLLHGDPFLDNLMVGAEGATLIDWDEAAMGPLAYDLASALVGSCFNKAGQLLSSRMLDILTAYNKIRPLAAAEKKDLPKFIQANALIVAWYRWRAFHVEVTDAPEDAKQSYLDMVRLVRSMEGEAESSVLSILGSLRPTKQQKKATATRSVLKRPAAAAKKRPAAAPKRPMAVLKRPAAAAKRR
eukprot:TRINITY_DN5113_c0_g1_i8.p1 TRINITY_DN5113_c0_g1~~TRINITY_DN5113_c0_g1_i8.p1  ORF type:complete len:406 (+),score=93.23 TRINITY_DN5113_c0_g1_i8:2-1219(+)